jgi:hypothetical protein
MDEETYMKRAIRFSILFVALISFSGHASANEFTDVIDSFDYAINDPFDINISVGYLMSHKHGVVSRENTLDEAHEWDFYAYRNMFEFKHVQHILDMNLEVGIFRDISLRIGLPLILSDSRSLTAHSDWVNDGRPWKATSNQSSTPLFGAFGQGDTFNSPRRSGVDYFSVGLWANPLDQSREITFPTWTLFVEGRFGVGKSLRASCADGQNGCDDDFVDRGGVGRGVHEIHFGTRLSRRISRLFDPYFGVDAIVGFPKGDHSDTDFFASEEKAGQINTLPPIRGTMDVGFEIIPWEQKSKHQRLVIGLGGGATYNSEGREYTPLYDALGTSDYFLDSSYFVDFNGNGQNDAGDERKAAQRWTGMTDIENYVTIFGNAFVLVQPAKYIKFRIGGRWAHETEHFITKTDMCSIGLIESVTGSSKEECENYNYGYRPELDTPGARFKAVKTFVGDFYLNVTAMF